MIYYTYEKKKQLKKNLVKRENYIKIYLNMNYTLYIWKRNHIYIHQLRFRLKENIKFVGRYIKNKMLQFCIFIVLYYIGLTYIIVKL